MSAFRVGVDDAEYLENKFSPTFTKNDLTNNPTGSVYIRLLVNGFPTVPFSMMVDWDSINATAKDPGIAQTIRERSRNKYGVAVEEVEKFIIDRIGITPPPPQADPLSGLKERIPF